MDDDDFELPRGIRVDLLRLGNVLDDFLDDDAVLRPDVARVHLDVKVARYQRQLELAPGRRLSSRVSGK